MLLYVLLYYPSLCWTVTTLKSSSRVCLAWGIFYSGIKPAIRWGTLWSGRLYLLGLLSVLRGGGEGEIHNSPESPLTRMRWLWSTSRQDNQPEQSMKDKNWDLVQRTSLRHSRMNPKKQFEGHRLKRDVGHWGKLVVWEMSPQAHISEYLVLNLGAYGTFKRQRKYIIGDRLWDLQQGSTSCSHEMWSTSFLFPLLHPFPSITDSPLEY